MRGDDGYREHVWNKRGSRFQLPWVPRPSHKALLRAIPSVGVVALSLVGFLAVPAGSPPPPPAVAAEPIATDQPTDTPTPEAITQPAQVPPTTEAPPPVCHPKGRRLGSPPPASVATNATEIVYDDQASILVYNVTARTHRTLLAATSACGYGEPRFVDRRTVAFIYQDRVATVDTVTGVIHVIASPARTTDSLFEYSITQKGDALAVLRGPAEAPMHLLVTSLSTGRMLFSRKVGFICACDGTTPIDLQWSRDGSELLVGVPSLNGAGLVYLFDRIGRRLLTPLTGATPRWLGDTRSFVYETWDSETTTWVRVDAATQGRSRLFSPSTPLTTPTVSPDGTQIAFSNEESRRFLVYDVASKRLRAYGQNQVWPVWLSETSLAISTVAPCNCKYPPFGTTGVVTALDLDSGSSRRMGFSQTSGADVLY